MPILTYARACEIYDEHIIRLHGSKASLFITGAARLTVATDILFGQRPCTSKVSRELRIIRVAERTLTLGSAALVRNCLAIVWQRTELDKFDRAAELGDGTQGCRQLILQGVVR